MRTTDTQHTISSRDIPPLRRAIEHANQTNLDSQQPQGALPSPVRWGKVVELYIPSSNRIKIRPVIPISEEPGWLELDATGDLDAYILLTYITPLLTETYPTQPIRIDYPLGEVIQYVMFNTGIAPYDRNGLGGSGIGNSVGMLYDYPIYKCSRGIQIAPNIDTGNLEIAALVYGDDGTDYISVYDIELGDCNHALRVRWTGPDLDSLVAGAKDSCVVDVLDDKVHLVNDVATPAHGDIYSSFGEIPARGWYDIGDFLNGPDDPDSPIYFEWLPRFPDQLVAMIEVDGSIEINGDAIQLCLQLENDVAPAARTAWTLYGTNATNIIGFMDFIEVTVVTAVELDVNGMLQIKTRDIRVLDTGTDMNETALTDVFGWATDECP